MPTVDVEKLPIESVGKLPIERVGKLTSRGVRKLPIRDDDGGLLNRDVGRVPMDTPRRMLSGVIGGLSIDDIGELPI